MYCAVWVRVIAVQFVLLPASHTSQLSHTTLYTMNVSGPALLCLTPTSKSASTAIATTTAPDCGR